MSSKNQGFKKSKRFLYAKLKTISNRLTFIPAVYDYLGCWQNNDHSFLPEIPLLYPKDHEAPLLHRCAKAALLSGIPVFGIRNNSVCVGSVHAALIYMRYGPSTSCYNGTGGPSTMDVYGLEGKTFQIKWLDKLKEKHLSQKSPNVNNSTKFQPEHPHRRDHGNSVTSLCD